MKNRLLGISILLFLAVAFASCNKDEAENEDGWYNSIPNGTPFLRANTLQFYYIDAHGNSLIDPDDPNTFPVTFGEVLQNPLDNTKDYDSESGLYNGNHNSIHYDPEEKLHYCTMTAYGDFKQSSFSYPVYANGDEDQIAITYKYSDKDVAGGKYWAKIISWKYNGKQIYSDDDKLHKKIFITKADGKTTVSLTR